MHVEPISRATESAALEYLSRSPYANVFIVYCARDGFAPSSRRRVVLALDEGGVRGVAYCGRQLVLAADDCALAPLADHVRHHPGERMIVGPREMVRAFWELVRPWHARPRLVRERQLVMMLDRRRLRPFQGGVEVRPARMSEWSSVADSSARMIAQELGEDPRRMSSEFAANVRRMIARKLWWVGVANERLCFFCSIGPWSEHTAQLQGVWTPPELRGRGLARASLGALCDRLLGMTPTLSLYVNDFNAPAIALYERVGFEHVADFQTLLF